MSGGFNAHLFFFQSNPRMWVGLWTLLGAVHPQVASFSSGFSGRGKGYTKVADSKPPRSNSTTATCVCVLGVSMSAALPHSDSALRFMWSESRTVSQCHMSPVGTLTMPQRGVSFLFPPGFHSVCPPWCLFFSAVKFRLISTCCEDRRHFLSS